MWAQQLLPGRDQWTYTAPNLQYLMDSPAEFSAFSLRTFTLADTPDSPSVRLAVHHAGTDAFAADVERIVRETQRVFGEYPVFDGGTYTFIADYLPWASGDGMEHRNSTILTSGSSIRSNRSVLLAALLQHEPLRRSDPMKADLSDRCCRTPVDRARSSDSRRCTRAASQSAARLASGLADRLR